MRYLFGPVTLVYANEYLHAPRQFSECLAFNSVGDLDLTIKPDDDWEAVCSRLPEGWRASFVVLNLAYTCIPRCFWKVPIPLIGLAPDWNLLWHYFRKRLPSCELVLTDTLGVETMSREGMNHGRPANLFGCGKSFLLAAPQERVRDIDVLFVGNFHPAVQADRLPWFARLSRLKPRWKVVLTSGVFGQAYRELLARSRIVFNRSIRGECNMRVFEAAASGALLFQEEGNREVPNYLQAEKECIYYRDDNLETRLEHYLEREEERQKIADAARAKVSEFGFEAFWDKNLAVIEQEYPALMERVSKRPMLDTGEDLLTRSWQLLGSSQGDDTSLFQELRDSATNDSSSLLSNSVGVVASTVNHRGERFSSNDAKIALEHFQKALHLDSGNVMAGLNAVEALLGVGQTQEAIKQAQKTLEALEQQPQLVERVLEAQHFPPLFDWFRVEWERAAWSHAGQRRAEIVAKTRLLRWRLHQLLGDLTGELEAYQHSHSARPDIPCSQAALGCALGRAGRFVEAVPFLREAIDGNPFDAAAARALFQALGDSDDSEGQKKLADARCRLARCAPTVVVPEAWFAPEWCQSTPVDSAPSNWLQTITPEELQARFGTLDTSRALVGFTNARDTRVILTLLAHCQPKRILEIGTALGQMTANFTEWSREDASILTLGTVADLSVPTMASQCYETPDRASFGRMVNHFHKADKVFFITADSLTYDFRRLAPLDFAFIDGAHDLRHVLGDTLHAYQVLRPGGYLVWHDFTSPVAWVEVRQALERIRFREPVVHATGTAVAFLQKAATPTTPHLLALSQTNETAPASVSSEIRNPSSVAVIWEGTQQAVHSFALVNRELCSRLIERGHEVNVLASGYEELAEAAPNEASPPAGYRIVPGDPVPLPRGLAERFYQRLSRPADVHIRHQWPPRFTPPTAGHWVILQPWEYGSIPKAWVAPLSELVDEIWAYSQFVRDCYLASGIPAERVQVVPMGVNTTCFHPEAKPLALKTQKSFKFLFVGGTIHRKGIDVLLEAYSQAFTRADDVCLVIKDMGVASFYKDQTAEQLIAAFQQRPEAPEIEYQTQTISEEEVAGLYTACDCLVHPYRGEGFGLPLAEAMACGLPVVVTDYGAALDFCNRDNAYLIPSSVKYLSEKRVGDLETIDYPWMAEPDAEALRDLLRHVRRNREEARAKGQRGCKQIREHFTWDRSVQVIEQRFRELCSRPIRRLIKRVVPESTGQSPTTSSRTRPRVSLCMIVKNEESNLPECLEAVAGIVDEMVIVDTGSTDKTKEVAVKQGAKVFDFAWVDSFAAARNESLCRATGDWIFWLDADDRLDATNAGKLRELFAGLTETNAAFVMKCLCLPDPDSRTATIVDHVRLFPNRPEFSWDYRVHEQILPSLRRSGVAVRWSDVVIHHVGYQDPALRKKKLARDLRLLKQENAERPNDPFILFNLGSIYQELGLLSEAVPLLQKSLERSHPRDSIVRKLYALLSQCHRLLGQKELSLAACRKGREFYSDDVELLFQEGLTRQELGDWRNAEVCWLRLLEPKKQEHFASVDTGLSGHKTRHNLAVLYQKQGRWAEARMQWQEALKEEPTFLPARLGLSDLHRDQNPSVGA